jgi:chromate reductase, NAD(P)H dehydrogenase (quinone)
MPRYHHFLLDIGMKIVGISGSLRKASTNTGLLRYAAVVAKEVGVEFEIVDISGLPLMNEDLEIGGQPPAEVLPFRATIQAADALIFACPEYNYGPSAALKNALDWGSRAGNVWARKPAAIAGSGGGFGTGRAQLALRQSFIYLDVHPINKPEVCIRRYTNPSPFDSNGDVVDSATQTSIRAMFTALVDWTNTVQSNPPASIKQ